MDYFRTVTQNSRLVCWGAGPWLDVLAEYMELERPDLAVVMVVDSARDGTWRGIPIERPGWIAASSDKWDYVLLCTAVNWELEQRLLSHGIHAARIVSCPSRDYQPGLSTSEHRHVLQRSSLARFIDLERQQLESRRELVKAVRYIHAARVPGDVLEFGTNTGQTAAILAASIVDHDGLNLCEPRDLILIDSFAGLPDATGRDRTASMVVNGLWGAGSCCTYTEPESLKAHVADLSMLDRERIVVLKTWYRDLETSTFPCTAAALIHLDCDLYASTREALGFCLAHRLVSPGCILLFDDWNCNAADPSLGQRAAWSELVGEHDISSSDEGGYSELGHAFIVHNYQ